MGRQPVWSWTESRSDILQILQSLYILQILLSLEIFNVLPGPVSKARYPKKNSDLRLFFSELAMQVSKCGKASLLSF